MVGDTLKSAYEATMVEAEFPQPCIGLVFIPTGQGLKIPLFKRSKGEDTWWDMPGGKRALSEDPSECIMREMKEELGIDVRPYSFISSMPHPKFGADKSRHFIACEYQSGTPENCLPDEHDALELCSPCEAIERLSQTNRIPQDVVDFIYAELRSRRFMSLPTPIRAFA